MTTGAVSAVDGLWQAGTSVYASYQGVPVAHTGPSGSAYTTPKLTADNWPIYVDLASASSVTINSLRNAITLQQWFEKKRPVWDSIY